MEKAKVRASSVIVGIDGNGNKTQYDLSHILMSDEIAYRESGSGDDSDDESDAD
jgi:hypothetical protein